MKNCKIQCGNVLRWVELSRFGYRGRKHCFFGFETDYTMEENPPFDRALDMHSERQQLCWDRKNHSVKLGKMDFFWKIGFFLLSSVQDTWTVMLEQFEGICSFHY